jgi:hypothetical protein
MLRRLDRADKAKLKNIETVLGSDVDPKLPGSVGSGTVGRCLSRIFSAPERFGKFERRLSPPVPCLLEYRKEVPIPIITVHKMTVGGKKELEASDYFLSSDQSLPRHTSDSHRAP